MSFLFIDRLPEKVKIRAIEKLSNVVRCKLRRTCKALDAFVEEHRFEIAKWSEEGKGVGIDVGNLIRFLALSGRRGVPDIVLENPYNQLSAVSIAWITVTTRMAPNEEIQQELISWMRQLKLATYGLQSCMTCHFAAETTILFLSLCPCKNLDFMLADDIPIDKFFALDTLKNSGYIRLRKPQWDEVPVQGFLEQIKPYGTMHFEVTTVGQNIYENVLPQYVMDASIYEGPVPVFKIEAQQEFKDPKSIFPNLLEVFKKAESHQEMTRIYMQELNKKLLLIKSCELDIDGFKFNCWTIVFSNKEKDMLKHKLEDLSKEKVNDDLLSHIFGKIVSCN